MNNLISSIISDSISVKQKMLADHELLISLNDIVKIVVTAFKNGGKLLLCGNGGSAADAQHIAAELSGRFFLDRDPLFAEALHVNSSALTAVANDYSFEEVYARMVKAMGRENDVLIAISTSGNSPNVLNATKAAKTIGMKVIGFTGAEGGALKSNCDVVFKVPSTITPRIQEAHILAGHILCQMVEKELFAKE
jgi:D-sedoheptulose 7-phosphate isomerase